MPSFFQFSNIFYNCLPEWPLVFSSIESKHSQKPHDTKSGEKGDCGTILVEFLAKWSRRTMTVCGRALKQCKNDFQN